MITRVVFLVLKMNRSELNEELIEHGIYKTLSALIQKYPWNNFFQLRMIAIYEEILEMGKNPEYRQKVLEKSNIVQTVLAIREETRFSFESQRQIRHGYMGMITKLSNSLASSSQNQEVSDYLDSLGEDWTQYLQEDLKSINEINQKKLGGQEPKPPGSPEDEEQTFQSMEDIMGRFSNFSSERQSQNQQEDEDEEEAEEFDSGAGALEPQIFSETRSGIVEVEIETHAKELMNFSTNIFWSRKPDLDEDLDLSEFE